MYNNNSGMGAEKPSPITHFPSLSYNPNFQTAMVESTVSPLPSTGVPQQISPHGGLNVNVPPMMYSVPGTVQQQHPQVNNVPIAALSKCHSAPKINLIQSQFFNGV